MRNIYSISLFITILFSGLASSLLAQNTCATAQAIATSVNDCVFTEVTNVGLSNSGQTPPSGSCPGYNGGDLWLSSVVPPSGEITFRAQFKPGTSNLLMDINMAVYSGTCTALNFLGCDDDSGEGFYPEITLTGRTPGETIYIQLWDVGGNQSSPFDFCSNGAPTCTSPTATFNGVCGAENEYSVNVNISSLGDATELNITNNAGAPAINGITSTGTQTVGPFPLGTPVTITVVHAEDASCNVTRNLTDVGLGCTNVVSCGSPLDQTYCYRNNDNTVFRYSSTDGSPITLTFVSGLIQNGSDKITIRDGALFTDPLLFDGANGGNLAGLTRTASSGTLYLRVTSDVGGSCSEGSLGLGGGWSFNATCEGVANPNCDNAISLTSQTTFAVSEIDADLSATTYSGLAQCQGAGGNPDPYFTFTAVGSVTYFRVEGGADFDPVVEVFDACGGTQLACVNDGGIGQRELFWLTDLTVGENYVYRVYHAGASAPANTAFETAVAHIPVVEVRAADCGRLDLVANDIIRSNFPSNTFLLDGFVWEFTELEAPFGVYEVNSPNGSNPQFRMYYFADFEYGRTYSVRVKARMYQGANEGEYGAACTIGFDQPAGSALQPQYENGFYQLCDIVKAVPGQLVTNYRWTFTNADGTLEYNSNSSNYFLPLQNVAGIQLGTSYVVNVFITSGGIESTTSIDRTLNMVGSVPNTSLNPGFLACGSAVSLTQSTQAFNICGASSYTFRFTNSSQPLLPAIEVVRPNRVIVFNLAPGLVPGDTYEVAVKANVGGLIGDYSSECEITILGLSGKGINATTTEGVQIGSSQLSTASPFGEMSVFPNPNNGSEISVVIEGLEETQGTIEIAVLDMTGKRVYAEQLGNASPTMMKKIDLSGQLSSGIYVIHATADGKLIESKKLIVE